MKWIEAQINGAAVRIAFDDESIHIFDAYPIKDDLKKEGFRWNPVDKSWILKGQDPREILVRLTGSEKTACEERPQDQGSKTPGSGEEQGWSIAELRDRIDSLLLQYMPDSIWVRGVVVSEIKHYRWASYFDLGDEENDSPFFFRVEVPAERLEKIEQSLAQKGVAEHLEKDLPLLLNVSLSLSQRYAVDVRLTVRDILAEYTQSRLRNQREITLDRLRREGIADRQRQLVLPMLIERVGLISSSQGTSVEDIRSAMAPHARRYGILFCDARMEGAMAVSSVVSAIHRLVSLDDPPDLIILARGGGSEQSLAVFNDYRICREVCLSPIPVLAAIGHEKDLSAAELCAHIVPSPSTPSGAGKYLAGRYEQLLDSLKRPIEAWLVFGQRLVAAERRALLAGLAQLPQMVQLRRQRAFTELTRLAGGFDQQRMLQKISDRKEEIRSSSHRLIRYGNRLLELAGERIKRQGDVIGAHSPERVLKRGFTMLFDKEGRVISRLETFLEKQSGRLLFQDGETAVKPGGANE